MKTINVEAAYKACESGAVLVDVRSQGEFRACHATGAICIPLDELKNNSDELEMLIGESEKILLICQSGKRASSAYEFLRESYEHDFQVVDGGTDAWVAADLPVEKGKGAISIERQVKIGAGSIVLVGSLLGFFVCDWFMLIPIFVGSGLTVAGITDFCGMGLLLAKMPWNK
jgi:rhodanese-related sulfurtransferase